jgi:hypothetical protein
MLHLKQILKGGKKMEQIYTELNVLKKQKKDLKIKYLKCKQFSDEKEILKDMIDNISALIKIKEQQFLETI